MASVNPPYRPAEMSGPGAPSMMKQYCDLWILCEDKIWKAHRVLLSAASKRLQQLITSSDKITKEVTLVILKEAHVDAATVDRLLSWCYNQDIKHDDSQLTLTLAPSRILHRVRESRGSMGLTERSTESNGSPLDTSHEAVDAVSRTLQELNLNDESGSKEVRILSSLLRLHKAAITFEIEKLQKFTIGELGSHAPAAVHTKGFVAFVCLTINFSGGDVLSYRPCYVVADVCAKAVVHLFKDKRFHNLLKDQPLFSFLLLDSVVRLQDSQHSEAKLTLHTTESSNDHPTAHIDQSTETEAHIKRLSEQVSKLTADNELLKDQARVTAQKNDKQIADRDFLVAELTKELASKNTELQQFKSQPSSQSLLDPVPQGHAETDSKSDHSGLARTTLGDTTMSRHSRGSGMPSHRGIPTFLDRQRAAGVSNGPALPAASSQVSAHSSSFERSVQMYKKPHLVNGSDIASSAADSTATEGQESAGGLAASIWSNRASAGSPARRPQTSVKPLASTAVISAASSVKQAENTIVSTTVASSPKLEAVKKENVAVIPPHLRVGLNKATSPAGRPQSSVSTPVAEAPLVLNETNVEVKKESVPVLAPHLRTGVKPAPVATSTSQLGNEVVPVLAPHLRVRNGVMSTPAPASPSHQGNGVVSPPHQGNGVVSPSHQGNEVVPVLAPHLRMKDVAAPVAAPVAASPSHLGNGVVPVLAPHLRMKDVATAVPASPSQQGSGVVPVLAPHLRVRNGAVPATVPTPGPTSSSPQVNGVVPVLAPHLRNGVAPVSVPASTPPMNHGVARAPMPASPSHQGNGVVHASMPASILSPENGVRNTSQPPLWDLLGANKATDTSNNAVAETTTPTKAIHDAPADKNNEEEDGPKLPPHMRPEIVHAAKIRKLEDELATRDQEIKTLKAFGTRTQSDVKQWGTARPPSPPRSRQYQQRGRGGGHMGRGGHQGGPHNTHQPPPAAVMRGGKQPLTKIVEALAYLSLHIRVCGNIDCGIKFPVDFRGITDPDDKVNIHKLILKCSECNEETHRWDL